MRGKPISLAEFGVSGYDIAQGGGFMYELVQAGPCSYYLECPAKIGVYLKGGTDAYLIDGGSDAAAAKKALQALAQNGWNLAGVLITHSNADHIGGNHLLQSRTGCRIYSSGAEAAITENPILSPSFVYGGFPFSDLRHTFLLAQPSCVTPFSDPSFPQEVGIIPLPGHCFEMVGFRTPDDTVFLADCVCSEQTLSKYAVTFLYDVAAHLETLDKLEQMQAAMFVPAHAPATRDIAPLVRVNRAHICRLAEFILAQAKDGVRFEQLLQAIFNHYGQRMTLEQYALAGNTVRSYLSWLKEQGRLRVEIADNLPVWTAV